VLTGNAPVGYSNKKLVWPRVTQEVHLALTKDDKLDVFAFEHITSARRWRSAHKPEED
jgi:hypothetical protein